MKDQNLEALLLNDARNSENIISNQSRQNLIAERSREAPPLKADKSATLQDFIKMVSKIVGMALKKEQVKFVPDEGNRAIIDPNEKIEHPYITYRVISREPKGELKPREREYLSGENTHLDSESRQGSIYGQKQKCYIQFDIIASEYSEADEVMNTFEDLIFSYTHFFKKNGVAELLFKKHYTDENLDVYRQTMSIRSLQYYVEIEKLIVVFDSEIKDIQIN